MTCRFLTIDAEPCWELRSFPFFLKLPQQLKRYMCEKFRLFGEKKQKICSLDQNEAWRSSASELSIYIYIFCLPLCIYMSLLWSKVTVLGCNRMKVNFVCVHILVTTLLFSAESIYNSRWCSDSPSSATARSQLRNKRFFHLKGFPLNATFWNFCVWIRKPAEKKVQPARRQGGASAFGLVLHSSARDGVPRAGPVVTHELRHR